MIELPHWSKAGGLHWWDVSYLKAAEGKREKLRGAMTLQPEDFDRLVRVLETCESLYIAYDELPQICAQALDQNSERSQELYSLISLTYRLTYYRGRYTVAVLRDVSLYERERLIERTNSNLLIGIDERQ